MFDVGVNHEGNVSDASVITRDNYVLRNLDSGQSVEVGAVRYDTATRTAELLFETLPAAEYELTVSPTVQSEQGIPIGDDGFSTTFRVFEDVTASMDLSFSHARVNRADGTSVGRRCGHEYRCF